MNGPLAARSIGRLVRGGGGACAGRSSGFTLLEIVITAGTTLIAILGSIQLFTYCMWQSENVTNINAAMHDVEAKVEEIRATPFTDIITKFGPSGGLAYRTFTPTYMAGLGVIYLTPVKADLLQVEVAVSWQERGKYVVGEDRNLNGVLDGDEDLDGNGRISSPASLVTLVARR